jgi:hypothetical protein
LAKLATTGAWSELGALRLVRVGADRGQRLLDHRLHRDRTQWPARGGGDEDVVDQLLAALVDARAVLSRSHLGDHATVSKYVGHKNSQVTARVYAHAVGTPAEQAARVAAGMQAAGLGY